MRYYISDMHFFHESLNTQMDMRGFANLEEMHTYMIDKWNGRVRKRDEVVILGDFSVGKGQETNEILRALNGKKYLILGNHDKFVNDKAFDTSLFEWIHSYKELHDNNRKIIMSHYPILCYNGQYSFSNAGNPKTYMLYGHVHDTYDEVLLNRFIMETRASQRCIGKSQKLINIPCQMINCFCMFSDYTPLSLDEWIELDEKRRFEKWPEVYFKDC